jgi:biopolymer transport protein ExbD
VSAVVAGWSLIVIYESATERLRAINLYDGLASFRGSQVVLTPDGFRVPATNIDGRIAVFTLEGDPANSEQMNGVDEALRYNGFLLDDGINVAGSDPLVQQFDGTINTQGISTSYGIDVDQYDITARLSPGQTSGTTTYSAGADLVLLMAQIVSATSDPAVDLGVTMSHTGTFVSGGTGTYTITVSNAASVEREDNTVTITGKDGKPNFERTEQWIQSFASQYADVKTVLIMPNPYSKYDDLIQLMAQFKKSQLDQIGIAPL